MKRRPRPLPGHRERRMQRSRLAPRLRGRGYRRSGGPAPGPDTSQWWPADPGSAAQGMGQPGSPGGGRRRRGTGRGPGRGTAQARADGVCGAAWACRAGGAEATDWPAGTLGGDRALALTARRRLARSLAPGSGRGRGRPVARPDSVESGLRVAANPAAPFARPALPPSQPPPSARPLPALHDRRRLSRCRTGPAHILLPRRRLQRLPLHSRFSWCSVAQARWRPAGHAQGSGGRCARGVSPWRSGSRAVLEAWLGAAGAGQSCLVPKPQLSSEVHRLVLSVPRTVRGVSWKR